MKKKIPPMKYWDSKSNCAQSVSCGLLDSFNFVEGKDILYPALIHFGAGFGDYSVCGAITGGLSSIALILSKKGLDNDKIRELSEQFKKNIEEKFNSLLCRDYMKSYFFENGEVDWDLKGRREKCTEVVQKAYEEAKKIIDVGLE
jgi:C_GCAxxG_C_C family probable redox protein